MVSRLVRLALLFVLPVSMLTVIACGNDNDVTGSGGALASLNFDMPQEVHSGVAFDASVSATAVGVTNVANGVVTVTLPSAIQITSVDAEAGTSATFSGSAITWTLNTLDSNTTSRLTIHATGTLPAGTPNQNLSVQASMVADGIATGELVVNENFTLMQ